MTRASFNVYGRAGSIAGRRCPGRDRPLLSGEFHFGALDRGMWHQGLIPDENQEARAQSYKDYVLAALKNPQFIGVHWFQWRDQPNTGRSFDDENYQIGFVDVTDTPYPEMLETSRSIAKKLYRIRSGNEDNP